VQPAEPLDDLFDHALDGFRFADVAKKELGVGATGA
jgi:hypothetical protein